MNEETKKDDSDYLGYGVYAETLWARVISALDSDQQGKRRLGDDPLVVGIFGEWGAGKSTLLKLIERHAVERAQERAAWRKHDGSNFSLTVPVFFQPWKYEHELHLHVPILLHILAALKQHMEQAQTPAEWVQGKVPEAVKKHMDLVVGTFGLLLAGAALAMDTSVPLSSRVALAGAGLLAKVLPKLNPDANKEELAKTLEYKENGRFFYEMHETLQAITRPRQYAKHLTGVDLSTDVSINFVVFIDDLDRCLPEKAVETLELIKTVFNLESFAFVLALDEEVVERGIGHRYKDYALQNKKPEMPITGFEYLEKIVYLPFRLPALTAGQAAKLLRRYEESLEADTEHRWFDAPPVQAEPPSKEKGGGEDGGKDDLPRLMRSAERVGHLDLWPLLSSAFDQYVPRKLIRVAELMQQLGRVNREPGRTPIARRYGQERALDPRVVLALVLLQLFAPDIYRFMRRRPEAFSALLGAFVDGALPFYVADAELMDWVVPKKSARSPRRNPPGAQLPLDALHTEAAERWRTNPRERAAAQNLRLPLVRLLLEHRALARHVFDPIKLFQTLAADMAHTQQNARAVVLRPYLRLLVETTPREQGTGKKQRHRLHHVNELAEDMLFDDPSVRANLLDRHDVPEDAWLASSTVEQLAAALSQKLSDTPERDRRATGASLIDALSHTDDLQDAMAPGDRQLLQAVLKQAAQDHDWDPPGPLIQQPQAMAQYADLRSTWGWDQRFDPQRWQLPQQRWTGHGGDVAQEAAEPVVGFVRLQARDFTLGVEGEGDNLPETVNKQDGEQDFFMARYLTTVAQFKAFVDAGGYNTEGWWDTQGWAWKNGQWASATNDPALRRWLDDRTLAQRQQPMEWAAQQRHPSRAVWGINWFEARAYVRWLSAQLHTELKNLGPGYEARLPTEWQWERAARAGRAGVPTQAQAPWGEDEANAHKWANISTTGIDHANVVGLFPANPVGLCDLHGNLWEWQDNLSTSDSLHLGCVRQPAIAQPLQADAQGASVPGADWLKTHKELSDSDLPALRGGAWDSSADLARASIRNLVPPDGWLSYVGFRVVLSLPN